MIINKISSRPYMSKPKQQAENINKPQEKLSIIKVSPPPQSSGSPYTFSIVEATVESFQR